jgi:excisionase family DNA binding protein
MSRPAPISRPPACAAGAGVRTAAGRVEGMPRLFTTEEVAGVLRCSPQHVRALVRDELLGAVNIASPGARPQWRISEPELREFLKATARRQREEKDETDEIEETHARVSARAARQNRVR